MGSKPVGLVYHRVAGLLEPGEIAHLEQVAAWLKRPAWAVIIDEVRRQHGRPLIDGKHRINRTEPLYDQHMRRVCPKESPLDAMIRAEDLVEMRKRVERLPPLQRRVVKARLEGRTIVQVADYLGCSTHNVEHHLRVAKKILAGGGLQQT